MHFLIVAWQTRVNVDAQMCCLKMYRSYLTEVTSLCRYVDQSTLAKLEQLECGWTGGFVGFVIVVDDARLEGS